ncbi:MliC family protein [Dyella terrae]|uniref:MliC family protein n=1 Tax=Dyella terrae TaxID=522259 RepID=UPI001EFC679B|nr:MliC family protein [Dyella terrae]ULU26464.1 MliC family protein [Dyella terrae]
MNTIHYSRRIACTAIALLAGTAAMADTTHLPPIPVDNTLVRDYQCHGGQSLKVTYYNRQGGQSFAMLTVKGNAMLFVDTLAASGVRYVAGPYVWWTKGNNGDLYDMTAGPNAAPIIGGCTSASH